MNEQAPVGDADLPKVRPFELAERPESHRESLHHLSEEIAEDLGHPATRKGWLNYWKDRLENELQDAPQSSVALRNEWIAARVREYITEGGYVERRTAIMRKLASRLTEIDQHIDYPESEHAQRRAVFYDNEKRALQVKSDEGTVQPLLLEHVVTDLDWGVTYRPAPDVPLEVWRKIRKRADIAEARRDLEALYNRELAETAGLSLPTTSISGEWIEKHFHRGGSPVLSAGIIGERMAKNVLGAMGRADKTLGLRVENSNAFEDAELKYDFKLALPNFVRGVATELKEMPRSEYVATKKKLGIQFTTSTDPELLQKKTKQLDVAREKLGGDDAQKYIKKPVDDIVLVALNFHASKCYHTWLKAGKPPGGPEQFISAEEKAALFQKVTTGLYVASKA
ncbi:MAG: hypothetical protein Q7S52_01720 [bacterium]|nr:hypothetical protein [bacterium]